MLDQPSAREQFTITAVPPAEVAETLYKRLEALRRQAENPDAWDWKTPDHFHVTLAVTPLIPITETDRLERILGCLKNQFSFQARINQLGLFYPEGRDPDLPAVIWAGFEAGGDSGFRALNAQLANGFNIHDMPHLNKDYTPHMTAARPQKQLSAKATALVGAANLDWQTMPVWHVDSISLMQKLTYSWQYIQNAQKRHHEIARYSLSQGKIIDRDEVLFNGDLNALTGTRSSQTNTASLRLH